MQNYLDIDTYIHPPINIDIFFQGRYLGKAQKIFAFYNDNDDPIETN